MLNESTIISMECYDGKLLLMITIIEKINEEKQAKKKPESN